VRRHGEHRDRQDRIVTETRTTTENTRKEWWALAVLGLPTLLVAMDFSVLYLATPHLSAALAPSGVQQLWIIDIYGFVIAGFLVTMGTLGDRIGRKKLLLVGGAAFALASVSAAYSTSAEMLLISRAVLGVAGAAVMPSTLALATGLFSDPKLRSRDIAIYLTCFMGGMTLGPLVGGVLLAYFWWGSVFLVSVPGIVLLLALGPSLLPDQKSLQAGRLDPISVVMSLAAILPFVYGLKGLARDGWEVLYFLRAPPTEFDITISDIRSELCHTLGIQDPKRIRLAAGVFYWESDFKDDGVGLYNTYFGTDHVINGRHMKTVHGVPCLMFTRYSVIKCNGTLCV